MLASGDHIVADGSSSGRVLYMFTDSACRTVTRALEIGHSYVGYNYGALPSLTMSNLFFNLNLLFAH